MDKTSKTSKYKPADSDQNQPEDGKSVKKETTDKKYSKKDAAMDNPATKRKFSEQPPSKHNTRS